MVPLVAKGITYIFRKHSLNLIGPLFFFSLQAHKYIELN